MISTLSRKFSFDLVFDCQKVFRLVLEAMSNPARVVRIREYADALFGDQPTLLALAITLLDNEVSFDACENKSLTAEIASLTLARRAVLKSADFVFVSDPCRVKEVIENVKHGTLSDPHKSATVIIRNDEEPAFWLTLSGPGIRDHATVHVSKTVVDAVRIRDEQNYEYPQGIDLIFVSSAGELFALPRLVSFSVEVS